MWLAELVIILLWLVIIIIIISLYWSVVFAAFFRLWKRGKSRSRKLWEAYLVTCLCLLCPFILPRLLLESRELPLQSVAARCVYFCLHALQPCASVLSTTSGVQKQSCPFSPRVAVVQRAFQLCCVWAAALLSKCAYNKHIFLQTHPLLLLNRILCHFHQVCSSGSRHAVLKVS